MGWLAVGAGFSFVANSLPLFAGAPMSGPIRIFRIALSAISLVLMVVSAARFFRGDSDVVSSGQVEDSETRYQTTTQPYEDPGWLLSFSRLHPGPRRKGAAVDGVVLLRVVFLAFLLAVLMILFVLGFIIPSIGTPDLPLGSLVVLLGFLGIGAAAWTTNRELEISSPSAVAASYRTHFFLGFALVEAPLMMSFVLCFLRQRTWPYLIALPLYLVGMALIAPSRRNLERRQEQISQRGSNLSLGRALASLLGPGS
jgi:hypothetical protein